ncbi:hypothetical protein B0H12DRAFT_57592 [Mycena haematopus]|nr:hypothetical protein B0H12DRAFT_57592 [Mycena haematopus]
MGGDHKCPVCQATFTRPQHVARHMRSHTGDRPYKCQHCGDQFARSDLLSRHVNKCHAAEKALLSNPSGSTSIGAPGGSRRKQTAATRATTSKQACDQCVQSSLPCDGSNPCSKCTVRKTRCTFVKFHRQTAPVGPGHPSSLPASSLPSLPSLESALNPASLGIAFPNSLAGGEQPFLYAQQQAGGGYQPAFSANDATFDRYGDRFAHRPGTAGSNAGSPTSAMSYSNPYPNPNYNYDYEYRDEYAESEHSGASASVSGGSRPASSAGVGVSAPPTIFVRFAFFLPTFFLRFARQRLS